MFSYTERSRAEECGREGTYYSPPDGTDPLVAAMYWDAHNTAKAAKEKKEGKPVYEIEDYWSYAPLIIFIIFMIICIAG